MKQNEAGAGTCPLSKSTTSLTTVMRGPWR